MSTTVSRPPLTGFEETEVAFAGRTDAELRRARTLFRTLQRATVVSLGKRLTSIAFALRLPIEPILRRTIFPQFVGGESIDACGATVERLRRARAFAILDYSVEGKEDESSLEAVEHEIARTIENAAQDDGVPFAVFKMTGLAPNAVLEAVSRDPSAAERPEFRRIVDRVGRLCARAAALDVPIMIDAEHTWEQGAIDRIALEMMRRHNRARPIVWTTVQLYLKGKVAFIEDLIAQGRREGFQPGFKLVRGAYLEVERERAREEGRPDPTQPDKAATDRDYDAAIAACVDRLESCAVMAATHNARSALHLARLLDERGIDRHESRAWSAQLYGMSDNITFALARAGYNAAKYVPYGPVREVVPYLQRRAEENSSLTGGQSGRELELVEREIRRRAAARRG